MIHVDMEGLLHKFMDEPLVNKSSASYQLFFVKLETYTL